MDVARWGGYDRFGTVAVLEALRSGASEVRKNVEGDLGKTSPCPTQSRVPSALSFIGVLQRFAIPDQRSTHADSTGKPRTDEDRPESTQRPRSVHACLPVSTLPRPLVIPRMQYPVHRLPRSFETGRKPISRTIVTCLSARRLLIQARVGPLAHLRE